MGFSGVFTKNIWHLVDENDHHLECRGREAYLKNWQSALSGCADNPTMKIDNLAIETEGTLAYSTSNQHFTCTDSKGNKSTVTVIVRGRQDEILALSSSV
jgi:ketosteroid isomerase-like protein